MANSSKRKGYTYEKEVEADSENNGISCRLAPLSNGRLMGLTEGVDGTLNDEYKWQAKCKAKISPFYIPNEEVDFQIFKGNRTGVYATMTIQKLAEMVDRTNELYLHNESLEAENKEVKDKLFRELK